MKKKKYSCKNCRRFEEYHVDYDTWKRKNLKANCTCNCPVDYEEAA